MPILPGMTYKLEKNYIAELLLHRKIRPQRIRPWRPAGLTFKKARGLWEIDSTPKVVLVAQPCPTLCNPMYRGPPGSSVHGILQARTLEWTAIPFSIPFSWPFLDQGSNLGLHCKILYRLSYREDPFLKGAHNISSLLGPRAEAVIRLEPGSDLPASLRASLGEAGGNGAHSGDTDAGSLLWHTCWQACQHMDSFL